MKIDFNADVGESFGAYSIGSDAVLMPIITSANIACGFHAGDPQVMARTVALALEHGVGIGAHPGFRDLVGFGRRALDATPDEIESDVLYQIGALAAFVQAAGGKLSHVKAHGALYNLAAVQRRVADAVAHAVARFDPRLILVGLANSELVNAARAFNLRVAREGFPDRAYNHDGSLRSRREPGAIIHDPYRVAEQALQMARDHRVITSEGETVSLEVDTLCIHGDDPAAAENARAIRKALEQNGITVMALNS
jgi:5-oxoprolinase (ATP-hydrolysing) subunit A